MGTKFVSAGIRWIPAVVVMAIIFIASATPSSQIPTFGLIDFLVKKGGHFFSYMLLGIALCFALGDTKRSTLFSAVLLAFLYACSDELHQIFTSGRHPSPIDVGIDTIGAVLGAFLWRKIAARWPDLLGERSSL